MMSRHLINFILYGRHIDLVAGHEQNMVTMILEELAHKVHQLIGVRMHRLAVCEWEVKLWLQSAGPASGVWRIVVKNITGYTCSIHVTFYFR